MKKDQQKFTFCFTVFFPSASSIVFKRIFPEQRAASGGWKRTSKNSRFALPCLQQSLGWKKYVRTQYAQLTSPFGWPFTCPSRSVPFIWLGTRAQRLITSPSSRVGAVIAELRHGGVQGLRQSPVVKRGFPDGEKGIGLPPVMFGAFSTVSYVSDGTTTREP
jgi:hypothetical protein